MKSAKKIVKKVTKKFNHILANVLPGCVYGRLRELCRIVIRCGSSHHYYAFCCTHYPVQPELVCYKSHSGAGMVCNPYALFCAFQQRQDFNQYRHVWVIQEKKELKQLKKQYAEYHNVSFVRYGSKRFIRLAATAKYLIENTSFPAWFSKREEQVYLHTWHSITVKKIGYDQPQGNIAARNMARNFLQSDYILSPNPFMTGIYLDTYRMREIYTGKIIEEGYPRNDRIHADRAVVLEKLRRHGISVDSAKKIILYAPTWRGESVGKVQNGVGEFEQISNRLPIEGYSLLIKPHHLAYKVLSPEDKQSGKYIPPSVDTNELLSVVDILISDYSSIFFDFMLTGRPVLFYLPDLPAYEQERGIYFKPEELPGPVTDNIEQLGEYIRQIDRVVEEYKTRYQKYYDWACPYEDGHVSERVLNILLDRNEAPYRIRQGFHTGKKRLLFHGGAFATNGYTTSLLSLLRQIDYSKYDVTVFCTASSAISKQNVAAADPRARFLVHWSFNPETIGESLRMLYVKKYGFTGRYSQRLMPHRALRRDYYRCMGGASFDAIIAYSGYSIYYPLMLLENPLPRHLIWQHSDLAVDITNKQKRNLKTYSANRTQLGGLCSLYSYYDAVVSSSKALCSVNKRKLATPETAHKFTWATNTMDVSIMQERLRQAEEQEPPFVGLQEEGWINFVAVGRLSPEKNHRALIDAFARLMREGVHARLYIVGGGDLEHELAAQSKRLGLEGRVILTGNMENPFQVLRYASCFVMPSLYEGQGLAALEARLYHLPIILSRYEAVDSVCLPNGQYLVGFSADEIYEGLRAFLDGKVPSDYHFDLDEYNAWAYEEFERLFRETMSKREVILPVKN